MPDIAQLKQWCDDARKILSLTGKDSRGKMKDRNADVAKLLEKMDGIDELKDDYAILLKEYEAITERASQAAEDGNKAEVANASRDLWVLGNNLRIKLAEDPEHSKATEKSAEKAEKKMESTEKQQWAADAVKRKRQTLLDEMDRLAKPGFAGKNVLEKLDAEREKGSDALADDQPTPEQFQTAEQAIAALSQMVEAEKTRIEGRLKDLLEKVDDLDDPDFASGEAKAALDVERQKARDALAGPDLPTLKKRLEAEQAIAAFGQKVAQEKTRVSALCVSLRGTLRKLTDPSGTDVDEAKAMKVERDKADAALSDATPIPAKIKKAETAIAALKKLVAPGARLDALEAQNPKAGAEARLALEDFKQNLYGVTETTDETVAEAGTKLADANKQFSEKLADWRQAKALPEGTEKEKRLKEKRLQLTVDKYFKWEAYRDQCVAYEKAVLGHKLLTDAISHGPLSGESGRPFEDSTAENFVKAYTKDPLLADFAVKTATGAKYPGAIAGGLDKMIPMVENNFASNVGAGFDDSDYSRKYSENLLRMGGEIGDEFFTRLPDYIDSDHQFDDAPLSDKGATSFARLAQKRSVTLATKLMKPDGTIDLTSDDAKGMIGNMLFHPDAMRNQTPAMNAHILKTLKFLGDPVTGQQASDVLKATTKPTDAGAQKLVRTALGKGDTDPIDDGETRTAVLAAMLKPLDQGPVGSCFTTAPARRMRETQPLDAMQAFSDIASKGTYKPANGVEVPVVANTPADEDPIQRSWEYTLATSTARTGDSKEKRALARNIARGADQLKTTVGGKENAWKPKKAKLKQDVKDAFTFVYDPMSEVSDSNDGSSEQGRYVIMRGGKEIRTRDDFVEEMAEVAIESLGFEPNSKKANAVKALVETDAFVNAVCPDEYKPWELSSGGQTEAAAQALFGSSISQKSLLAETAGTAKPSEGERTTKVLNSFLKGFAGSTDEMVTMRTVGKHGFNALPNHPSLAGLKGNTDTETAQKVQTNLVDKGQKLKNTELSAERAAWLFDQEMQRVIASQKDDALIKKLEEGAKARRPTAPMKPAALTTAIKEANAAYHDLLADKRAEDWKSDEVKAGRTVADQKLTEKKSKMKEDFDSSAEEEAKSLLIRDMGAPEFVIADTNWGNSKSHTFFVIAPDPTTGDPILWKKVEPPGSLEPAGREWVDAEWAQIA